ncbi:MAG: biotin carboxylase N-terminal domain-containing protein [Pseudomonadota bacterium]
MFKKILIANRGEIACRIARTCRRLGIAVAGVHSSADRDALHTAEIGESIGLGGASAAESYLRIDAVIAAALRCGAQAIHPGYGFLAENPEFARAVEAAGLVFIGPTPEVIERLGNKASAKAEARAAGVAVLDGGEQASADVEVVAAWAGALPLPVLLKPAAGGGGKGMHVVRHPDALIEAIGTAMREARSAFGDPALIVEPYIERGRHVEVQIAGDGRGNVIHLFERECTLQRRHQKLIEEAPAAPLPAGLREQLLADAVRLAQRLNYRGVGTVEFLVSGERHWFLEVNPRLQVEHPVTEAVTGIDIVELMLRVAAGEGMPLRQADVVLRGHAVEARVCAEDAAQDFMPSTGEIVDLQFPVRGVRVETGVRAGSVVTPYYDSMLAKLIVHASARDAALDRLSLALGETRVLGVTTNCRFLQQLIALPVTRDGSFHTRSVDEVLMAQRGADATPVSLLAAAAAWWLLDARQAGPGYGAWSAPDVTGWQMHAGDDPVTAVPALLLRDGSRLHEIRFGLPDAEGRTLVQVGDERIRLTLRPQGALWQLGMADAVETLAIARRDGSLFVQAQGRAHVVEAIAYLAQAAAALVTSGELRTPMMGTILKTHAGVGDTVRAGDVVVTMESMKMEMKICAEHDGVLRSLTVTAGQTVERGLVVAVVDAADAAPAA